MGVFSQDMDQFGSWPLEVGSTVDDLQPYKKISVASLGMACTGVISSVRLCSI